jgi:hypothetical protein
VSLQLDSSITHAAWNGLTFISNSAYEGGGMHFSATSESVAIVASHSLWLANVAALGSVPIQLL